MAVTIMCPNLPCRAVLRVPDSVRGKTVRCGQCGMVFAVPEKSGLAKSPQRSEPATPNKKQ